MKLSHGFKRGLANLTFLIIVASMGWQAGRYWPKQAEAPKPAVNISHPVAKPTPPKAGDVVNGIVQDGSGKTVLYWYDPMEPTQKFEKPGKSPFMDMMLEPKYAASSAPVEKSASMAGDAASQEDDGVHIAAHTQQNLGMKVATVEKMSFGEMLSAVGRIEPDERRFYTVQPRVGGFVEKLMVRAIGDAVGKGQKIAEVYSPELLAAQQEYLALREFDSVNVAEGLPQAAKQRLKLLGMTEAEIEKMTQQKQVAARFGVYAPASGIITELGVREGGQLAAGAPLAQIADLSSLWVIADVPERDAARLKVGMQAKVTLQSMPDQVLTGRVGYLYPALDETTRSVRVRIELANPHGRLKTGMYANVDLSGTQHQALAVPSESIISTGKRKVVIVKSGQGFRPVAVETGLEQEGRTEIIKGLSEGDSVITSGQFLIDSEAALSGVLARLEASSEAEAGMASDGMQKAGTP